MLDASLPLEALSCSWLALPAWFLVLTWFSCLCGGGGVCLQRVLYIQYICMYVYVYTSHNRDSSSLLCVCDTVVILLFVEIDHSSYCEGPLPLWLKPY